MFLLYANFWVLILCQQIFGYQINPKMSGYHKNVQKKIVLVTEIISKISGHQDHANNL